GKCARVEGEASRVGSDAAALDPTWVVPLERAAGQTHVRISLCEHSRPARILDRGHDGVQRRAGAIAQLHADLPAAQEVVVHPLPVCLPPPPGSERDRKSTRLNSSHLVISYAVFCLKKKNN